MNLEQWTQPLLDAGMNFWSKIAAFMPKLVMTIVVVLICLAVIRLFSKALVMMASMVYVNVLASVKGWRPQG